MADKVCPGVAARLSTYLRIVKQCKKQGIDSISSQEISEYAGVNPTQVRRDLSTFGKFGKRGVGYRVDSLIAEIQAILYTGDLYNLALVGAGHLGSAIATSTIFRDQGFQIAAIFDSDPHKIGCKLSDLVVKPASSIPEVCHDLGIILGIIAVPPKEAQRAADELIRGDVRLLLNYTETLLNVPPDVYVHDMNPAEQILYSLYCHLA